MNQLSSPAAVAKIPRAFWFYLLGVHLVYSLLLTQRFELLDAPTPTWGGLSFAESSALIDLLLLPALCYGFLARKQLKQAIVGALGMLMLGSLAIRLWFPVDEMSEGLRTLLAFRAVISPLLWGLVLLLELYLLVQLARFLLKPMKEEAVEMLVASMAMTLGREHWLCRYLAAETRVWIYALSRRLPAQADFEGKEHFGYAQQNGNASTWLGFSIANLLPAPILHFILERLHWGLAWVTSLLTVATSVWMWAEYRASLARPISLSDKELLLRYGTIVDRRIALSDIVSFRTLSWRDLEAAKSIARKLRPRQYVGMGGANVELVLSDGSALWIGVDQPQALLTALARAIAALKHDIVNAN